MSDRSDVGLLKVRTRSGHEVPGAGEQPHRGPGPPHLGGRGIRGAELMSAFRRTLLLTTVVVSAVCSGGCSRFVQMYVRNNYPFAITVHESTEWQYGASTNDSGKIAPQAMFSIANMSREEVAHLQMAGLNGTFLGRMTVNAATVNEAYWNHNEIVVEVKPGQNRVVLGKLEPTNASGSWRTFGMVTAVLVALLVAFRSLQKRT